MKYILNSDLPAKGWRDGYPIGNGRIAAMIWGDEILRISLNNEWLWTGQNGKRRPEKRSQFLGLVRQVMREAILSVPPRLRMRFGAARAAFRRSKTKLTALLPPEISA